MPQALDAVAADSALAVGTLVCSANDGGFADQVQRALLLPVCQEIQGNSIHSSLQVCANRREATAIARGNYVLHGFTPAAKRPRRLLCVHSSVMLQGQSIVRCALVTVWGRGEPAVATSMQLPPAKLHLPQFATTQPARKCIASVSRPSLHLIPASPPAVLLLVHQPLAHLPAQLITPVGGGRILCAAQLLLGLGARLLEHPLALRLLGGVQRGEVAVEVHRLAAGALAGAARLVQEPVQLSGKGTMQVSQPVACLTRVSTSSCQQPRRFAPRLLPIVRRRSTRLLQVPHTVCSKQPHAYHHKRQPVHVLYFLSPGFGSCLTRDWSTVYCPTHLGLVWAGTFNPPAPTCWSPTLLQAAGSASRGPP